MTWPENGLIDSLQKNVYHEAAFKVELLTVMSRRCGISGKSVLYGNNVSHAHNKTRRRFLPNMQNVSFTSELLNRRVRLRMSVNGIRTVEQNGGIDAFLLSASSKNLGAKELAFKKLIEKKAAQKVA